ncbi:MAG: twin-arginine translocase TatA/TatE family subunit [Daejeonella sp.]
MMNPILLFGFGTGEIIIIVVVILLLFGGRKIPELMRGLGKGVKEFKNAQNGDEETSDKHQPNDKDQKVN